MDKKRKTLIIVDFQYDFCDPDGALYVPGADDAEEGIIRALESNNYDQVIFTVDWHNVTDKSFAKNGGQWAEHCVQYTRGAAINQNIFSMVCDLNIPFKVVRKGMNPDVEEYGAFSHILPLSVDEKSDNVSWVAYCENTDKSEYTEFSNNEDYEICGLAGDFCVYETYKNIKNMGIDVKPLYEGIAFINDDFTYDYKQIRDAKLIFRDVFIFSFSDLDFMLGHGSDYNELFYIEKGFTSPDGNEFHKGDFVLIINNKCCLNPDDEECRNDYIIVRKQEYEQDREIMMNIHKALINYALDKSSYCDCRYYD